MPTVSHSDKMAFHDADTDTDTDSDWPDTSIHPYVRHARFPREDPREEIACVGRKTVAACLASRCRCPCRCRRMPARTICCKLCVICIGLHRCFTLYYFVHLYYDILETFGYFVIKINKLQMRSKA